MKRPVLPKMRRELERIDAYRVARHPYRVKLDQNESSVPLPDTVRRRVLKRLGGTPWERYPQHPPRTLQRAIARKERCAARCVLVGHGMNELLYAAALATVERGSKVVMPTPSYPVARLATLLAGARIVRVPLGRDFVWDVDALVKAARTGRPRLVYVASPNNPTGAALRREDVAKLAASTEALVVVDRAYREFARVNLRPLLETHVNLVLLFTLSKAYRLAGLRIGYALGHPEVIQRLERAKPPHSVDIFAQIAAEEVLSDRRSIAAEVKRIVAERERVAKAIDALPGTRVFPSQANFLLVRFTDGPATHRRLLQRGVLVRRVDSLPDARGRLANCLRITIGTNEENAVLVDALDRILGLRTR